VLGWTPSAVASGLSVSAESGERAERLGFDAVWVGDSPLARARHDALTMLAALAVRTERVAPGTAVMLAALRQALLLAQGVATVDQLAQGRVILGLGAGFPYLETERQFEAIGVPYAGRVERMTEAIVAVKELWSAPGRVVSYEGRHIRLQDVALAPGPHGRGGPPVWLAGAGDPAERRVGRVADGWLPYPPTPDLYAQGWERVREAAQQAGRATAPVPGLCATIAIDGSPATAQRRLRRNIERYYQQPLDWVGAIHAMYAGTADGFRDWLDPYGGGRATCDRARRRRERRAWPRAGGRRARGRDRRRRKGRAIVSSGARQRLLSCSNARAELPGAQDSFDLLARSELSARQ
jgi:alkanesulfonate monooxygenase SsuD/methylene tetrahydromethanopterin reductase-like flavin-dependent oxidoreductase (luciferase family)